jgi:hypothetical protein
MAGSGCVSPSRSDGQPALLLLQQVGGPVLRAVVDQDELVDFGSLHHPAKDLPDGRALVVHRNDDAQGEPPDCGELAASAGAMARAVWEESFTRLASY